MPIRPKRWPACSAPPSRWLCCGAPIVELTDLGATRYGGNFSHYRACKALELAAAQHELAHADKRLAELGERTKAVAERKARKDRTGTRKRAKGDVLRIQLNTLRNRSEATSASNARWPNVAACRPARMPRQPAGASRSSSRSPWPCHRRAYHGALLVVSHDEAFLQAVGISRRL